MVCGSGGTKLNETYMANSVSSPVVSADLVIVNVSIMGIVTFFIRDDINLEHGIVISLRHCHVISLTFTSLSSSLK